MSSMTKRNNAEGVCNISLSQPFPKLWIWKIIHKGTRGYTLVLLEYLHRVKQKVSKALGSLHSGNGNTLGSFGTSSRGRRN